MTPRTLADITNEELAQIHVAGGRVAIRRAAEGDAATFRDWAAKDAARWAQHCSTPRPERDVSWGKRDQYAHEVLRGLAVDVGASKEDFVVVDADGAPLALVMFQGGNLLNYVYAPPTHVGTGLGREAAAALCGWLLSHGTSVIVAKGASEKGAELLSALTFTEADGTGHRYLRLPATPGSRR